MNTQKLIRQLKNRLELWYRINIKKDKNFNIFSDIKIFDGNDFISSMKNFGITLNPRHIGFSFPFQKPAFWSYPYYDGFILGYIGSDTVCFSNDKENYFDVANKYRYGIDKIADTDYVAYIHCKVVGIRMLPTGIFAYNKKTGEIDKPLKTFNENISFNDALIEGKRQASKHQEYYIQKAEY